MLDNAISEENTGVTEGMFPAIFSTVSSNVREEKILTFYCALARQCFINEYIFVYSDEEFDRAQLLQERLVAALAARLPVPVLWLVAVAAYFPLISVPSIEVLLDQPWSVDTLPCPL